MKPAEKMERLVRRFCDAKKSSVKTGAEMDKRVLGEVFRAYDKSRTKESVASQPGIWRIIMKSKITKLAAAAVIIAAALIGMKVLFGLGEQPPAVPVPLPTVSNEVEGGFDSPVDIELRQVREMFAAGDIKGLATMLAEGEFESQLLAADYLAQMEGGAEALEALENLHALYGKDDPGNPFTPAVEKIRARMQVARGSPPSATAPPEQLPKQERFQALDSETVVNYRKTEARALANAQAPDEKPWDVECSPELTEGASGKGYYFDGDGDYIEIPPIEGLGTEQTKTLWVYADGFMRSHSIYLIDEGGDESNNNWIELLDSDGNGVPNIRAGFDAGNLFDSHGEIEAGYWYHIAVVSTSAGDVFTYINGVFDSSHTGFSAGTQPKGIVIGAASDRRGNFKGIIDEVAFFNRALSDDEIWQIYQNTGRLRGNEAGLVGYWNFDNDEGQLVKDASPYGNHGTLGNGGHSGLDSPPDALPAQPEPPADAECRPELTEGASGYGYYFDGDGDYIEIPPIEGLGAEHTKMLWANPDASPRPNYVYLIDQDQVKRTGNNNWIELVGTDENGSKIRTGYDSGNFFDSDGRIQLAYWNHVAVVSTSAGEVRIYINGAFDSSHSGFSATQPEGILIGATSSDRRANFKGIIDEVAFFNRALSDDEIWQIYQNTGRLRGNEPGLVGYWNFDRDDGDTVRDMSRYGNNGKLGQPRGQRRGQRR